MVIAAHISGDISHSPLLTSLVILAEKNKADRFVIFSERQLPVPENMITVKASHGGSSLSRQYWYSYTLPRLLKKCGAGTFISDTGIISNKWKLPQFLFLSDHSFEYIKGKFFRRNFLRSLHQANAVFVTEDFIAEILKGKNYLPVEKIKIIYHGLPAAADISIPEKEITKEKFTGGYDYFLFPVDASSSPHAVILLKAFSQLKKRLRSSMKLVLLLNNIAGETLVPDFKNYKYRDEVLMIPAAEENADMIIPAAYMMIWLSVYTSTAEIFAAMQNGVAIIAEENDINKSLFGGAAVFTKISADELAEKMQLLYKDEALKNGATGNAAMVLQKYNAVKAAEDLYRGVTG